MPRISAFFTDEGVPLLAPGNVPTIRIRRQDTGALVVTDVAMTEQGDGVFTYDFAESPTLEYVFRCDGDPTAGGQVTPQERYVAASFSGITEARIETDIPAILVDTGTDIPARFTGIEGAGFLTASDSLEAIRNQGDAAWLTAIGFSTHSAADVWLVGTRELTALTAGQLTAIQSEILADATPFNGASIAAILLDTGTTLPARLTGIEGAGFLTGSDSLEAIRNQGDAAWLTAVGFSTHSAADVWAVLRVGNDGAGSFGEALAVALDILGGDTRIVSSAGDWKEEHLDYATGLIVRRRYDLEGLDTSTITDLANPFADASLDPNQGFMRRIRTL